MSYMGTLYVVATPIGNLGDITQRARETFGKVSVIAAEDTRVVRKLLSHFDIHVPVISYHARSAEGVAEKLVARLAAGEDVALVSDAGTPGISDPGTQLVRAAREAGVEVVAVPGPSALAAALSISSMHVHEFVFLGFMPHKKGRQTKFAEITESSRAVVFFESPHRIMKTLESLVEVLGEERTVGVYRELTKMHEEVVEGTPVYVHEYFLNNEEHVRGEFVVVVSGK